MPACAVAGPSSRAESCPAVLWAARRALIGARPGKVIAGRGAFAPPEGVQARSRLHGSDTATIGREGQGDSGAIGGVQGAVARR